MESSQDIMKQVKDQVYNQVVDQVWNQVDIS